MTQHALAAIALVAVGSLLAITGCDGEEAERAEVEQPGAISEGARQEAQELFATRCSPCHGQGGGGDGPAAAGMTPSPRDFRRDEWQQSVTDEHIERIIVYGGAAVGKSATMPANPDLQSKPEVVAALREHIRSLNE